MMTDARWSAATTGTRGAEDHRDGRRAASHLRAGKWCATALVAGAAVALSAGPAPAAALSPTSAPPVFWGEPVVVPVDSMPFIPRKSSGEVTFGLKGSEKVPSHVKKLAMRVYTPEHTRLVDATLTPLNGTPGEWKCIMTLGPHQVDAGGDRMECTSDYAGPLPATGQEWSWKMNLSVPRGWPMPPEWNKSTNGWAAVQAHSADDTSSPWSKSISMGIRTTPGENSPTPADDKPKAPVDEAPKDGGTAGLDLGGLLGGLLNAILGKDGLLGGLLGGGSPLSS